MDEFTAKVKAIATQYDSTVSDLAVGLAIEIFKDIRHYPSSFEEEKVLSDLNRNINKIAMASVEISSKEGVENQTAHTENGVTRTYVEGLMAYREIVAYAKTF